MADTTPIKPSGEQGGKVASTCQKCNITVTIPCPCERCNVLYCSYTCLLLDWEAHKKACAPKTTRSRVDASAGDNSTSSRSAPGLEKHIPNPFTQIDSGAYLHNRPERDVYKLLIDTYRLRMADRCGLEGVREADSLYAPGVTDAMPGFRRFLGLVEAKRGVLPSWWSAEKERECERLGGGGGGWSSLRRKIEKSDVLAHYRDEKFPMQLRMFGETIYGRGIGGQDGTMIRRMMMAQEVGQGSGPQVGVFDIGGLFRR